MIGVAGLVSSLQADYRFLKGLRVHSAYRIHVHRVILQESCMFNNARVDVRRQPGFRKQVP